MADHDDHSNRDRDKEISLKLWRRMLQHARAEALAQIDGVIDRLRGQSYNNPHDLNRYRAQMLNGVAAPSDFGGSPSRA